MPHKNPTVLLVDDSTDDLTLYRIAAREIAAKVKWRLLNSGIDALAYLAGEGNYANRELHPVPCLMILDLRMPNISGFDLLHELQGLHLPHRPFICALSTSRSKMGADKAIALGADVFHVKPFDFDSLCKLFEQLIASACSVDRSDKPWMTGSLAPAIPT